MKTLLILPNFNESWESVKLVSQKTLDSEKEKHGENLDVIHVERAKIFKQSKGFLSYKKIICLDHSVECLQSLKFIKDILKEDISIDFYALGMASSFYWPLNKWGLAKTFGKNDSITVSCSRDVLLTNYALPAVKVNLSPFRFFELDPQRNENPNKLFYIGRLCFLKNIHGLIHFFNGYRKNFPQAQLDIMGAWDANDLPFFKCEIDKSQDPNIYKNMILKLIENYGLQKSISFLGPKSQEEVAKYLKNTTGTFISLSLQNDENYGLAADQALAYGHHAILTNWGGHHELKKLFPKQVQLLETFVTKRGPGLLETTYQEEQNSGPSMPETRPSIKEIFDQREDFNTLKKGDVLFKDQTDPYYLFLSQIYSGKNELEQREDGFLLFGCEEILKQ